MEKYYIVTTDSPIYKEYIDYKAMSKKVNTAFVEFAIPLAHRRVAEHRALIPHIDEFLRFFIIGNAGDTD